MLEIKQPIAWEPLAELREFVALRPYMQLPQWQAGFRKFSSYSFEDLVDADIRSRMFDQLKVDGLIHHYYATVSLATRFGFSRAFGADGIFCYSS